MGEGNKEITETLLALRDLRNSEIAKLFKTEKYFSAYGKTFIPYRKFESVREKQLIDSLSTYENMAVRVPKDKDKYSYSLKNFKRYTENFAVDIFYCVDDKRFCSPYKDGLRSLNVSKLRKFYASELVEYKKENKELISFLENRNLNAEIVRNNLKNALSETATEIQIISFSQENYDKLFNRAQIDSPIEHIKLGENQFEKLGKKHREKYLYLVYETLIKPSLVINEQRISDIGDEISHNYIKSFIDESKIEGFQSVVVKIENNNVSITSHNRDLNNILSKIIMPEQLVYLRPEVGQAIEQRTQKEQSIVNQTKGLYLANESAYSTDISSPSNPYYDETKILSISDLEQNKRKLQEKIMNKNTKRLSDKDVEKAWESLENEPFVTNNKGEQVLDSENGWFGFDKGTTQQEIWRWFDTHHSKGVAYLVNDYEPEKNVDKNKNKSVANSISEQEFLKFKDTVLKDSIRENASLFTTVDFSRNNFNRLFPWSRIETPMESVKFGEGQFTKFSFKERRNLLAAVYETLVIPDIVLEEERFNEFNEPTVSHDYAKNFLMDFDTKMIQSVVVEIEGNNIIITSHERPINEILNKIKKADQILYIAPKIGFSVRQKVQNEQSMADQNLSEILQSRTSLLNKAYNNNEIKSIKYMLSKNLLTNNEVLRYGQSVGLAAAERINKILSNDRKRELEPSVHKNDTLEEIMHCIGDSYGLPEEATKKRRKIAIQTLNRAHIVFEKYSEYLERKNKARTEELNMAREENAKTISWNEIQEAADGTHWNDDALAVKNRAREQAIEFANEIGAELNADNEDDIESFVKHYGITFQPDGAMSENRYVLTSGNPRVGHDYGVQDMLAKYLEEESEKNASDNKGKEFASNFSRERFANGDLRTIIQYANHIDDGSVQWMLGARAGDERQLYYRDPTQFGEWQKATVQEFFNFVGDFYAHNYDVKNELDENSLSLMSQLFPTSKDIEKFWQQHYTKDDMQHSDVMDLADHSAHGEIWSYLPDIDNGDNPYVILENAVEAAASYLENNDGLKDKDFGNRSDSTEDEKNTRKEFLSLLKNANDELHSNDSFERKYNFDDITAENLDLLHAEVLKDCVALSREDFLSSFGEIIDGEYPNQEEAEYRRHTLNELRIDEKNLDNYLDDNATRLLENVYEKARTKSFGLYDFIEATVDTSDPTAEQEVEWNRALEELLNGYTDYKDFNEEWDVSLTPTTAKLHWLESEKDLIHIAFDNASRDDSVEVPAGTENYKNFLDSIDFEKRFSRSNILRAETLQMNNARLQEKNIQQDEDMERISTIFDGMEAPDLLGELKDIKGLIENYRNTDRVKIPVVEAISTMLYDSPQIHKNGNGFYDVFGALSNDNFDLKYKQDGTDARNELCDMVAEKIVADKSIKSFEQVKELLKIDSEKILKEKLDEIAHSKEFIEKFGDWEKANRIEKLKKSESLQISGKIIIRGKDETAYINELRSNPSRENLRKLTNIVADFGKEMLQNLRLEQNLDSYASPVLTINDDGKKYHINFSGIKETSHHNLYQKGHIEGIYNIPQIIESAIYLTTEKNDDNRKPELKQFHYYSLGIKLDDDDYTAKIVFTENRNGEIYYDQSLSTIEKGKLIDLLQTKNKPTAVNPINRRDSNGLSENESPSVYYDMRLSSICQVPQMPYLEMVNGRWQPTQEAIRAVEDGKLSVKKNGQKYVVHDGLLMEEKNMEKEDTFKISDAEMARLEKLFEGKTCLDSAGTKEVDFKSLVDDYKENKEPEDILKDAISMMLHSNRDTEEYYDFSPSIFDSENDQRDEDGYEMRWEVCDKTAEKNHQRQDCNNHGPS